MLAALAGRDWGWRACYLRRVYEATILSIMRYCGPAWQPWMSPTTADQLQRSQNRALRIVTGQHATTPIEALHLETGLPTMKTTIRRDAAIALERSLRLPDGHPRRLLASLDVPHRSKIRGSWRRMAGETVAALEVDITSNRESFGPPSSETWNCSPSPCNWQVTIHPGAHGSRRRPNEW